MSAPAAISINPRGGPVRMRLTVSHSPFAIAAVLWQYDAAKQPMPTNPIGELSASVPEVPLGSASALLDTYIAVEGTVLHNGDDPPVHYQAIVGVVQDDATLYEAPPEQGGSGEIGTTDVRIWHRLQFVRGGG